MQSQVLISIPLPNLCVTRPQCQEAGAGGEIKAEKTPQPLRTLCTSESAGSAPVQSLVTIERPSLISLIASIGCRRRTGEHVVKWEGEREIALPAPGKREPADHSLVECGCHANDGKRPVTITADQSQGPMKHQQEEAKMSPLITC